MTRINLSLTSIYDNKEILKKTIDSLLNQTKKADAIYIFLSETPYLLDKGIKNVPLWLTELVDAGKVIVRFVENTGPYRKLLPLLEEKWDSDELIITVDDDTEYMPNLVEEMVARYEETGACIGCRVVYVSNITEYVLTKAKYVDLHNFHTGKGGVLYHPSMFRNKIHPKYPTGVLSKGYLTLCATNDDIWFNVWRMYNDVPCVTLRMEYMISDMTNNDFALYRAYNEKDNKKNFTATAKLILNT
jgi:glycosyltransferase involved in cell wall biosynthesis